MKVAEAFKSIRSSWLNRVSRRLARGEELRESTGLLLNRFYTLMEMALDTGDPSQFTLANADLDKGTATDTGESLYWA